MHISLSHDETEKLLKSGFEPVPLREIIILAD